jgi:hypothetical protein
MVGVKVGGVVEVGEGTGVSVEVGAGVADDSTVTCPLHAVRNTAKNKKVDKNCNFLFFILFLPNI